MITTAGSKKIKDSSRLKQVWFYDERGQMFIDKYKEVNGQLLSLKDHERYAKAEIFSNNSKRCYIKVYRGGRIGEYVVDPASLLGNKKDLMIDDNTYGVRSCEYKKVTEDMFLEYIHYLSKRTISHLKNVERKFLNGEA